MGCPTRAPFALCEIRKARPDLHARVSRGAGPLDGRTSIIRLMRLASRRWPRLSPWVSLTSGLVLSSVGLMSGAEAAHAAEGAKKVSAKAGAPEAAPAPVEEPEPEPLDAADEGEAASTSEALALEPSTDSPRALKRNFLVFLEGGFRYDLGNFSRRSRVGRNEQVSNDAVRAFDPAFHVGFLSRMDDTLRMGAAFGYLGNYDTANNNTILGQMLTLDWRLELSVQLEDKIWLIATPRLGVSAILPSGVLQDRISANQRFGYDTWGGPRWGFLAGADAGVRYGVNDWFSLRATVGYTFAMSFLLDSSASTELVSASQNWQVQASRLGGNLGLEASF